MAFIKNRVTEFEKELCMMLAKLAHHIHPKIVERIQQRNRDEQDDFRTLFCGRIETDNYLFDGSACVFPGVRRYVNGRGNLRSYDKDERAIIDDNNFPRHLWCFLENGKAYSGPNWRDSGLGEFELAHIFTHKESELDSESRFFLDIKQGLQPHGEFTCAANVVLLPKGVVRPTDESSMIKAAFFKRYVELYGETPLNGRSGFEDSLIPEWYRELQWNKQQLPPKWESNIENLLKYRTKRIGDILGRIQGTPPV